MQIRCRCGDAPRLQNGVENPQQIEVEVIETDGSTGLVHGAIVARLPAACTWKCKWQRSASKEGAIAAAHSRYIDFSFD
jgi:hypothetical protein